MRYKTQDASCNVLQNVCTQVKSAMEEYQGQS